jgi:hypothetical protein
MNFGPALKQSTPPDLLKEIKDLQLQHQGLKNSLDMLTWLLVLGIFGRVAIDKPPKVEVPLPSGPKLTINFLPPKDPISDPGSLSDLGQILGTREP